MIDHAKILRVAAQRLRNGIPGTTTCGDALDEAADEIDRLREDSRRYEWFHSKYPELEPLDWKRINLLAH